MTTETTPTVTKHFTSSILLWVRNDQPRSTGMDYWKGPHSGIISATPGMLEYRQIHLAEDNPGRWPSIDGVETAIPADRKVDGIAEVTFESALSPLAGRQQTALAYEDEINVFRRTLLYAGPPGSSRWYAVAPGVGTGARAVIYLRRGADVGRTAFHSFIKKQLVPALIETGALTELRTQLFMPWSKKLWDTPNVAHDNPASERLNASIVLGFADDAARDAVFEGPAACLAPLLAPKVSAVHAYDVATTLTYVKDSQVLPQPEE